MNTLSQLSKKAHLLRGALSILEWDQETHMPPGSAEIRGEQISHLSGLLHQAKTCEEYAQALTSLIDLNTDKILHKKANEEEKACLKCWKKDYIRDTALPLSFVEEFSKLTSEAMDVWKKARLDNAFSLFAPFLDKIVKMNRKKADLIGYEEHPYDALLEGFEPSMTTAQVNKTFAQVQKENTALLKKIQGSKPIDDKFLKQPFDEKKQLELSRILLEKMGYDFHFGRLDLSTHPFSSAAHPTDSRITTRLKKNHFFDNVRTTLHEGGHALYEMGLPQDKFGTPLGEAVSLGIHESQSRWWETRIGMSEPFQHFLMPILQKLWKGKFNGYTAEDLYRAVNIVQPSFIRVEADEVTYPLHVILRFDLEKQLIEGKLKTKDVPQAWNEKMENYLGIRPPSDTLGCLQDVHWSMGAFGYFPTYALGNMYAAHFFQKFAKDHQDWELRVRKGDLLFIKKWLNAHIHRWGRRYTPLELLKKVNGIPFSSQAYTQYMKEKYANIYKLRF